VLKKEDKSPETAKKSKPRLRKKTTAEFHEKIEKENFDQRWHAILLTHTFTLNPLTSLGFSYSSPGVKTSQNTLCINGCQFKILLYPFKLAQLTSFESKNSFELSTLKRG